MVKEEAVERAVDAVVDVVARARGVAHAVDARREGVRRCDKVPPGLGDHLHFPGPKLLLDCAVDHLADLRSQSFKGLYTTWTLFDLSMRLLEEFTFSGYT